MITRIHNAYTHWMIAMKNSTTQRDFLYRCGRLDGTLDLLRTIYGKDSIEYKVLRESVHMVELDAAQRLGLSYPDDEQ